MILRETLLTPTPFWYCINNDNYKVDFRQIFTVLVPQGSLFLFMSSKRSSRKGGDSSNHAAGKDDPSGAGPFASFGYELSSKQVRQYRINDAATVKCAVMNNIQEFLHWEGVSYDTRSENTRYAIGGISVLVCAGAYVAGLSPFSVPFTVMKPFLSMSVLFYAVCSAAMYYFLKFVDSDSFFLSDPAICTKRGCTCRQDREARRKNGAATTQLGDLLEGKRVRIGAHADAFTPEIELHAELLDASVAWFRPGRVLRKVEKKISYGVLFDEDGFIYPPNLKAETHQLLTELMEKKSA